MKTFYHLLALLLGYVVLVGAFIIWGGQVPKDVMILDVVMSCVIYTVFAETTFFPMLNLRHKSHKEVGMMGLHYSSIILFAIVSVIVMAVGITYRFSFFSQLIGQLIALFVLFVWRTATLHSGEKIEQIYKEEQTLIQNKDKLSLQMERLVDIMRTTANIDPLVAERIGVINEELRFISPSNQQQALILEEELIGKIRVMSIMFKDYEANKENIDMEVEQLGYILEKRKKY